MVGYSNHKDIGIRHRSGVFDVPLGDVTPYTQFVPFLTLDTAKAFIDAGRKVDGHTVYDINTQAPVVA
jgi:hypothetical protein